MQDGAGETLGGTTDAGAAERGSGAEPRIVVETGLDGRIASLIEPAMADVGYRLVRVKVSGMNGLTLQIMAERPDGTMTVEDCERLSRAISPVLDAADPMERAYHLEVSSPGIDRPLVRPGDFRLWAGHLVKIETNRLLDARKRFRGKVVEVGTEGVVLERDQPAYGEAGQVRIPFDAVGEARLVLTDELIAASLRADKAARRARGETRTDDEDGEAEAPSSRN